MWVEGLSGCNKAGSASAPSNAITEHTTWGSGCWHRKRHGVMREW